MRTGWKVRLYWDITRLVSDWQGGHATVLILNPRLTGKTKSYLFLAWCIAIGAGVQWGLGSFGLSSGRNSILKSEKLFSVSLTLSVSRPSIFGRLSQRLLNRRYRRTGSLPSGLGSRLGFDLSKA